MNSITNKMNNEEGETEETITESLNEGLLRIFDRHNNDNTFKSIRTDDILEEALRQTVRMEEEQLDDHDFHELYESMKYSLGSYFSASVGMMMAFGILTAKEKVEMRTLLLLQKIEDKYKLRPLMKEVKSLAYRIRSKRMNHHLQPIIINVGRKESVMEDNKNDDVLRGLFEGGNFPNAQINVVTGDGVQISYESAQAKTVHDDDDEEFEYVNLEFFDMKLFGTYERQFALRKFFKEAFKRMVLDTGRDLVAIYIAYHFLKDQLYIMQGYTDFIQDIDCLMPGMLPKIKDDEKSRNLRYKSYIESLSTECEKWFIDNDCLPDKKVWKAKEYKYKVDDIRRNKIQLLVTDIYQGMKNIINQ